MPDTEMGLFSRFKSRYCHRLLAKVWHCVVPHIYVPRRMNGVRVYFDLNDNIDDLTRPDFFHRETDVLRMAECVKGAVWDLGCNIGQFAVPVSLRGNPVVAFDISPRACKALQKTAQANRLPITVVNRAVGTSVYDYAVPSSAQPTEHTRPPDTKHATASSITFQEVAERYGIPSLVKMDIEGGEVPFFQSADWKQWISAHGIYWIIEIHPRIIDRRVVWSDMPSFWLDEPHGIYHPDENAIRQIKAKMSATD